MADARRAACSGAIAVAHTLEHMIPNAGAPSRATAAQLSLFLRVSGIVVLLGATALEVRFIYEKTVWTWEYGTQNVGFSLAHAYPFLFAVLPLYLLWTAIVIVLTVLSLKRKVRISFARWAALGMAIAIFVIDILPEGLWERAFIQQMAASPHAADLMIVAAYAGDLSTVKDFLSHGVQINARNEGYWSTCLHAAAVNGDVQMLRYLLSRGAAINALDRSGDSPLELALSRGNAKAAKFLAEQGAKRIRGSEAQRDKASKDQVDEQIQEMNRREEQIHQEEEAKRDHSK